MTRCGLWLASRKTRLLNKEKIAGVAPTVLVTGHPAGWLAAFILQAAFDRQVHCLLPSGSLRNFFPKVAGRVLGITAFDSTSEGISSASSAALAALSNGGIVAVFEGEPGADNGQKTAGSELAAYIALEAGEQSENRLQPAIYPLHWFYPLKARESDLIYVDEPIRAESSEGESVGGPNELALLARGAREAVGKNVFRLEMAEVKRFQHDLEEIMREDLDEEWSQHSDWKQRTGDLTLSGFVKRWIDEQNRTDPGHLVAVRESADAYREARRRHSLDRYKLETSGDWHDSRLRLAAAWVESVLGFPVALYGLINHFLAGLILFWSGLLNKSGKRDPKVEWLLRAFIVLSCYTVQLLLMNRWLGRAAAGYYTLALPVSGAYLWRYRRLFKHRTQTLLLRTWLPARWASLRRGRKRIIRNINREFRRCAQLLGMPC